MKKPVLLLLAVLALSPAAFADDNAAKLALAREAITAMQADKMFDSLTAQMKQMSAQFSPVPPGATPDQVAKAQALQGKIIDLAMAEAKAMISKMDAVYASVYSEAELKAMIAFFTSPEGHSMMAKQPQVMTQTMGLIQQMQQSLMPKIKTLVDEAKAAPAVPTTP